MLLLVQILFIPIIILQWCFSFRRKFLQTENLEEINGLVLTNNIFLEI